MPLPEAIFDDKARKPDEADLERTLGRTKSLWDAIVRHVATEYPPLTEDWGFYKSWSLRLKRKARTVLYLIPQRGHFLCAFVLGAKAADQALGAGLPESATKAISEAPVYAEGRGFRLPVKTKRDVEVMKALAAIKMSS